MPSGHVARVGSVPTGGTLRSQRISWSNRVRGATNDAGHQAFGRRLGTPTTHPTASAQVGDFLLELDSRHGGKSIVWHTDLTVVTSYPAASSLRPAEREHGAGADVPIGDVVVERT